MKRKILFSFIFLISCGISTFGQDVLVNARNTNLYFDGVPIAWSSLASRNYVLSPIGPDYGFCISVVNNNPTSAHSFTITANQTGDFNTSDYSHNTGRYAPLAIVGTPSPIAANTTGTFFIKSNGASKVAFSFSGATTQAGSPDTVDIYGVQTTANGCGTVNPNTGNSYTLSTPNTGTSSAPPIMSVSDGLSQAYYAQPTTFTTPAGGTVLVNINANSGIRTLYFDRAIISSTAADIVTFNPTNSLGSGCTGVTSGNMKPGSGISPTSISNDLCSTPPNVSQVAFISSLNIAANTNVTIDLKGFIAPAGTTTGFDIVQNGAATGNVNVTIVWYEK